MNVAMIACGNGLGHVKRLVKVGNAVHAFAPEVQLSLFCEPWQIQKLERWDEFVRFRETAQLQPVSIPVRWSFDEDFYNDWLNKWHTVIPTWNLRRFDCVISDNLIEALLYNERTILSGSFLWHNVFSTAFPRNEEISRYREWAENLLRSMSVQMIANRYFVMPAVEEQTTPLKVGMINLNDVAPGKPRNDLPKNVLIAFGHAGNLQGPLEQISEAFALFGDLGMQLFCSARWSDVISRSGRNVTTHSFETLNFENIEIAMVLGGLGTISDCIAAQVPMLYILSENPELHFNQERLAQLGVGMSLADALERELSPLTHLETYQQMADRCNGFQLHGENEAAQRLITLWSEN